MVLHVSLITILNSFLSPSTDKNLPTDIIPKPTIFLPSINEVNHQQTATYLCLLENFFPDVIKVSWKEKNGNRVLPSQQGNTMKTNNTYMKFSWLTVTENSMKKEHMCIVRLEKNAGGKDQEILFPAVNANLLPSPLPSKALLIRRAAMLLLDL